MRLRDDSDRRDSRLENALVVTHFDLDGFVSAFCLLEALGLSKGHVQFVSYGSNRTRIIDQALRRLDPDTVFVCDVGLSKEDLQSRWATDPHLYRVLFDHHESTTADQTAVFDECYLDTSGEVCSADLVLRYLERRLPDHVSDRMRQWVALAHDRDLWRNEYKDIGQRVSWLLKERIHERLEMAMRSSSPEEFVQRLYGRWKRGEALFEDALACARNTAHLFTDTPVPIKIAYVKRDTSDVAEELQEGGQIIVLLNVFGQHVGVSLRADRDEIDVSKIAQRCFDGGGHRLAASGFAKMEHLLGGFCAVKDAIVPVLEEQLAHAKSDAAETAGQL